MGWMTHHAIVVTSPFEERIKGAHVRALDLFRNFGSIVSNICEAKCNGYWSFLIAPDGSKEGWDTSNDGDAARNAFIDWLKSMRDEEGSWYLNWCEVQFGDDGESDYMTRCDSSPEIVEDSQ